MKKWNLQVQVGDDDEIRHDIRSDEIRSNFPLLPKRQKWTHHKEFVQKRANYIQKLDSRAYETLKKHSDIEFKPQTIVRLSWTDRLMFIIEEYIRKVKKIIAS